MGRPIFLFLIAVALIVFGLIIFWPKKIVKITPQETSTSKVSQAVESSLEFVQSTPAASITESENIRVFNPLDNEKISFPLKVKGEARVFENQFGYRLKDANGQILDQGTGYANSPDVGLFGPFELTLDPKDKVGSGSGILEVFVNSAKDGTEVDKVVINLQFDRVGP